MMGLSPGTSDMTLNLRDRVWGRRPLWESGLWATLCPLRYSNKISNTSVAGAKIGLFLDRFEVPRGPTLPAGLLSGVLRR